MSENEVEFYSLKIPKSETISPASPIIEELDEDDPTGICIQLTKSSDDEELQSPIVRTRKRSMSVIKSVSKFVLKRET